MTSPGRLAIGGIAAALAALALLPLWSHDRAASPASPRAADEADGADDPSDLSAPGTLETRSAARREASPAEPPSYPLLRPGFHDGEIVGRSMPRTGTIRGRLRSESGTWPDLDAVLTGGVTIDLVTARHADHFQAHVEKQAALSRETDSSGEDMIAFSFGKVPEGEYELTLSSLGPYRWWPTSFYLTAPDENIEIWRLDRDQTIELAFRVLDDKTGAEIPKYRPYSLRQIRSEEDGVRFHAGPLDPKGFPAEAELEWSLSADGYAPAFGNQRDFLEEEDGRWVAEVRLRRGWGTRFVVIGRDPTWRPLFDALIVLDGKSVGKTDRRGRLDAWAPEKPKELDVLWADWKVRRGGIQSVSDSTVSGHVSVVLMLPKSFW